MFVLDYRYSNTYRGFGRAYLGYTWGQLSHQYLFTLLGSAGRKAARSTFMKLTRGDDVRI